MLKLINSIGQRKVSKILFFIAIFVSILCFYVDKGANSLLQISTWFGVFLMSAPIGFLSLSAHKTKDYRMLCLVLQITLIVMNVLIYSMKIINPEVDLFLFVLTLLETVATLVFLLLLSKQKPAKVMVKNKRSSTAKVVTETAAETDAK